MESGWNSPFFRKIEENVTLLLRRFNSLKIIIVSSITVMLLSKYYK
ncbi:hypothetical protein KDN24_02505 [Bacillus sp. Bva_UNVM-123]